MTKALESYENYTVEFNRNIDALPLHIVRVTPGLTTDELYALERPYRFNDSPRWSNKAHLEQGGLLGWPLAYVIRTDKEATSFGFLEDGFEHWFEDDVEPIAKDIAWQIGARLVPPITERAYTKDVL